MQTAWSNLDLTRAVLGLIERTKQQENRIIARGNTIRVMTIDRFMFDAQGISYSASGVAKIESSSQLHSVFGSCIYIPEFVETASGELIRITSLNANIARGIELEAEWIHTGGGILKVNHPHAIVRLPNCTNMTSVEITNAERVELSRLIELTVPLSVRKCNALVLSCGYDLTNATFLRSETLKLVANEEGTIPNVPDQRNINESVAQLFIPHACLGLNIADGTTLTSILQTYFGDDTEIIGY